MPGLINGADFEQIDGILQDNYLPLYSDLLQEEMDPVVSQLSNAKTVEFEGRQWVFTTRIGGGGGVGSRTEAEDFPVAGAQKHKQASGTTPEHRTRVGFTRRAIEAASTKKAAFATMLDTEFRGNTDDFIWEMARQFHGDGSAIISTCGTTTASQWVVLDAATSENVLYWYREGMYIDIGTVGNPVLVDDTLEILDVDVPGKRIKVSTAVTTTSAHRISRAGNRNADGEQRELTGLEQLISATGTLHNIDPTVHGRWASYEDASFGSVSGAKIADVVHKVRQRSGKTPDLFVFDYAAYSSLAQQEKAARRYTASDTLKCGVPGFTVEAAGRLINAVTSDRVRNGTAEAISTDHIFKAQLYPLSPVGQAGNWERVPNKDVFERYLSGSWDYVTDNRSAHARLTGVTA